MSDSQSQQSRPAGIRLVNTSASQSGRTHVLLFKAPANGLSKSEVEDLLLQIPTVLDVSVKQSKDSGKFTILVRVSTVKLTEVEIAELKERTASTVMRDFQRAADTGIVPTASNIRPPSRPRGKRRHPGRGAKQPLVMLGATV